MLVLAGRQGSRKCLNFGEEGGATREKGEGPHGKEEGPLGKREGFGLSPLLGGGAIR